MAEFAASYNNRLIDFKELQKLVPYSRTQIWRLENLGLFPKRIRLGPGRVVWSLSEVLEWIECKKQSRVRPGPKKPEVAHA